jgi:hypothetical protein
MTLPHAPKNVYEFHRSTHFLILVNTNKIPNETLYEAGRSNIQAHEMAICHLCISAFAPPQVSSSEDHLVGCYSGAVHKVCLNSQILEAGQDSSYYICLARINLIQWMCLLLFSEFNTLHLVVGLHRTIICGGGGGTMICRQVAHSCFVGHKHDKLFGNTCCMQQLTLIQTIWRFMHVTAIVSMTKS